jgi:hypothetical protein
MYSQNKKDKTTIAIAQKEDNKDRFAAKVGSNRGINKGHVAKPTAQTLGMLLSLLKETYHILLSSITIVLYTKEIFENWTRVVNKNQNTKCKAWLKSML